MRWLTTITLSWCLMNCAVAQETPQLSVRHTDPQKTVIMRYLPANNIAEDWSLWSAKVISPNSTVSFPLRARGPYVVACFLKGGASSPAQVSDKVVDLQSFAMAGKVYELDLTFHEDRRGREVQVMSATLVDPQGESDNQLTVAGNDAESEFVDQVLRAKWRTKFEAVQGPGVSGLLDLNRDAKDGGPIFKADQGKNRRLSEMLAFDDAAGCHIIGRWIRDDGNLIGTFHFLVSANSPNELRGTYKVDGQDRKYRWTGQRIVETEE